MALLQEEPWFKDKMDREGVAKFLTNYLDTNEDLKVLNVNAPWGAGKTFFLQNWHDALLQERAVIYFNAWTHDYAGDAFVALTAAINDALLEFIPTGKAEEALRDFRSKATSVILAATPALAKGVLKKFTGVDVAAITEKIDSEALADAAEKALDNLLQSNKETMQVVENFKIRFAALALEAAANQAVKYETESRPLYIFIDELDRCRPTFSIELLERIKHFFDVANCKFIIACDVAQLRHSIGAIYGVGFEGDKYLKRFFDAEYSLSFDNTEKWLQAQELNFGSVSLPPIRLHDIRHRYSASGDRNFVAPASDAVLAGQYNLNELQAILYSISSTFKLKPRELEKCLRQLKAISSSVKPAAVEIFFAFYLIVLRDEAPHLYRRVVAHNDPDTWQEICKTYPARSLYYGGSNEEVHSTAKRYFTCLHSTAESMREMIHADNQHNTLHSHVIWLFNGPNYIAMMKQYLALVDLSHSLE